MRLGRVSSGFGEDKERGGSLVLDTRGEVDMDDDGNSVMFKSGVFAGTESGTSIDQLQLQVGYGHGHEPTPPNANANANVNVNLHARPRISVDITQHRREGSVDMLEINLARTLEEDMYGVDAVPLSDTTIAVESKYYAAVGTVAAATAATTASAATADYNFRRQLEGAGADADAGVGAGACAEPYRFDFDALPLPPGMTLPPWEETLRSGQPPQAQAGRQRGVGAAERRIFAPLTNVLSPLVTRTQWIIIVRSALIGLLLACAVGGASMAIH